MTAVGEIIKLLEEEKDMWVQGEHTLSHKERKIEIWTSNLPYLDCGIYRPIRKTKPIEKIRLQLAINRWHKLPLSASNEKVEAPK